MAQPPSVGSLTYVPMSSPALAHPPLYAAVLLPTVGTSYGFVGGSPSSVDVMDSARSACSSSCCVSAVSECEWQREGEQGEGEWVSVGERGCAWVCVNGFE